MANESSVEPTTGRKYYLDDPDDAERRDDVTFILNLHGGGSFGRWQRLYFPACDFVNEHRLVVATPTSETREPHARWEPEADDDFLKALVEQVAERFGKEHIRAFWLAGHSQGGMTSFRLLGDDWFNRRVDGFLSLSGGRIGMAPRAEGGGRPRPAPVDGSAAPDRPNRPRPAVTMPAGDFSFIYTVGEHEIASLPDTSPWAEKYAAKARVRLDDVVDTEAGQTHDSSWSEDQMTKQWGRRPRPGTAQVYVYPDAKDGRVIADVVRLDKGHTEGLEPNVTDTLLRLLVSAPGGKLHTA